VTGHEAQTFLVRVTGWSMVGAGIHDGDEVLVDRAIEPRDGAVVVVARNGELSIKRLRLAGGQVTLVSENPDYPPVVWREGEDWHFWGVAIRVLHRL
jgi:DNA polymerase V